MKSPVVKRSIVIAGHKTSVSLEDAFWKGLKEIADDRDVTLSDLVAEIDTDRRHGNLSSAIRLFVLDHYRDADRRRAGDDGMPRDLIGIAGSTPSVLRADRSSGEPGGLAARRRRGAHSARGAARGVGIGATSTGGGSARRLGPA